VNTAQINRGTMANFDHYAEIYHQVHTQNIRVTGENSEYFAQYKARYIARRMGSNFHGKILDFGCGVGMLSACLKRVFAQAIVDGYDISDASLARVPSDIRGGGTFTSDWNCLGYCYDLIVVTNVLHHVPPTQRQQIMVSLCQKLGPEGLLVIVEHNPLNPLTRRAVDTCPFDDDAILLPAREVAAHIEKCGLKILRRDYIVFFPRMLALFRSLEPYLNWFPAGAQYAVIAKRRKEPNFNYIG
jgi:SAM-dependent methyltransferase